MNLKYFLLSALGLIASTTAVAQYAPATRSVKNASKPRKKGAAAK